MWSPIWLNMYSVYAMILLMEEILHHLGCIKPCKSWDFNYQPQLVSRISSINSIKISLFIAMNFTHHLLSVERSRANYTVMRRGSFCTWAPYHIVTQTDSRPCPYELFFLYSSAATENTTIRRVSPCFPFFWVL